MSGVVGFFVGMVVGAVLVALLVFHLAMKDMD